MAGSSLVLVASVVPSMVEVRREEVEGGTVVVSPLVELTPGAMLVPVDVLAVISAQVDVMAAVVGDWASVVVPFPVVMETVWTVVVPAGKLAEL